MLKFVDVLSIVIFFIEKKETKNSRRKNSLTQGKLPHPHFSPFLARSLLLIVFLPILDFSKKDHFWKTDITLFAI